METSATNNQVGDEAPISQLPLSLQRLLAYERLHLHKAEQFQIVSRDPAFDTRYFPQKCGAFRLPCFWVPRSKVFVYGGQPEKTAELKLFAGEGLAERVLFPIHPLSLGQYKEFLLKVGAQDAADDGLCIWGVPTSSTRTLLAWPDAEPEKALFVKTSLHSRIFGDRRLYLRKVGCSIGLSGLVEESMAELPDTFRFFPEFMGLVPRSMQDSGVIFRSIPQELKVDRMLVAPLFSLLSGGQNHPPLFLTIVERSGLQPAEFIEKILCFQFSRLWLRMSLHLGLIIEAHGQDIMLSLTPEMCPSGQFVYRDFEGLQVDWELRRQRGLPIPAYMPHEWSWRETYATWGYRYGELVWYKLKTSLYQYLNLFLCELDLSLREWQEQGLMGSIKFEKNYATMLFSRHMFRAIEEMFDVSAGVEYNIHQSPHRFVSVLLKLRTELIAREAATRRSNGHSRIR